MFSSPLPLVVLACQNSCSENTGVLENTSILHISFLRGIYLCTILFDYWNFCSFILNQSRSLSLASEKLLLKEVGLTEAQIVYCTNLPLFALHFLSVGEGCSILQLPVPPIPVPYRLEELAYSFLKSPNVIQQRLWTP